MVKFELLEIYCFCLLTMICKSTSLKLEVKYRAVRTIVELRGEAAALVPLARVVVNAVLEVVTTRDWTIFVSYRNTANFLCSCEKKKHYFFFKYIILMAKTQLNGSSSSNNSQ